MLDAFVTGGGAQLVMTTIGPRVGVGGLDVVTSAHREVGPSPEARCGVVVVGDMCPDICSVGTGVPDLEGQKFRVTDSVW